MEIENLWLSIYLYLFIKINLSNKYKTIIFIEYDFFNTLNIRVYDLNLYNIIYLGFLRVYLLHLEKNNIKP